MTHQDPELKAYAKHGLRSAEDWASLGRVIEAGSTPRTVTKHRGRPMELFGRDQTEIRPKKTVEVAPVAEPALVEAVASTPTN